jgi:hypothetical protein
MRPPLMILEKNEPASLFNTIVGRQIQVLEVEAGCMRQYIYHGLDVGIV